MTFITFSFIVKSVHLYKPLHYLCYSHRSLRQFAGHPSHWNYCESSAAPFAQKKGMVWTKRGEGRKKRGSD
jgi:hypothetical protein